MGKDFLSVLIAIVFVGCLVIGGYYLKRWWNVFWYYGDEMKETVCEMVKPEYLKNPDECK